MTSKTEKINDALETLNHAAAKGNQELKGMLQSDYRELSSIMSEAAPGIRSSVAQATEATKQFCSEAATDAKDATVRGAKAVDHQAHERPWYFVAGAAVAGTLLGWTLSRRR